MNRVILLIDDDEDEHDFFTFSMRQARIECELLHAYSGREARMLLKKNIPDIILIDFNMPVADGLSCIPQIRLISGCQQVPLYLYSTEITMQMERKAFVAGATGSLKKPNHMDELAKAVRNFIDRLDSDIIQVQV